MKTLFYVVLLSLWCLRTNAAVVYSQPPDPAGGLIPSSFLTPDGMDGDGYAHDSFVLATNQAITEIRWRGGDRFNGQAAQPVADFTVSIYGPGLVDSEPALSPLVQYSTGGNAGETLAGTFGGTTMYDYQYVLPSPFQAVAGTKYWVQIEASQTVYPNGWSMAVGTGGNGTHFQVTTGGTLGGGNARQILASDTAFSLWAADLPTRTITASASPANSGTILGAGVYPVGSTAALVATPGPGFGFVNWTENGGPVSSSATYNFTVTTNRTLVANFTTAYAITTSASPAFGGSTSASVSYNSGATATVVATPATGYVFVDWQENGTPVSSAASYTFSVTADRTLVATFALNNSSVTFDFDTGTPLLSVHMGLPLDQTAGGLTAHFSSPTAGAGGFSVQSDATMQYRMSRFSANYLVPNSVFGPALDIQFGQPLTSITLVFATADFGVEIPTTVQLTAYTNSAATPAVGSATAHGTYAGDTMPMGSLTFNSATPFNLVRIAIPYAPQAAAGFLVDNITVTVSAGLWPGAADLGNGWKWLDWFGYFHTGADPWIYHAQHGWLCAYGTSTSSIFFWDHTMTDWWWTSPSAYPYCYRISDSSWLWYAPGTSSPRWFYNLTAGKWETW